MEIESGACPRMRSFGRLREQAPAAAAAAAQRPRPQPRPNSKRYTLTNFRAQRVPQMRWQGLFCKPLR